MKIGLITSIFLPYRRGGAETVVVNIVNGFKKTNHQIFVITICPFSGLKSLWPQRTEEDGIVVYRFYPLNIFSFININQYKKRTLLRLIWHGLDIFNLHSYFVIRSILKKEKPEVVMTHMLKGIGYLTLWAIRGLKIKNIHTLHDVQFVTPSGIIFKGEEKAWQHTCFLTKLYQKINRCLLGSPEIVISSSKFLMDFYSERKFFPSSQKIILNNPISQPTIDLNTLTKPTDNIFRFLFLGQIEKHKGILFLIEVFKELLKELPPEEKAELLVVGTGSLLEEVRKISADFPEIKFFGFIPNNELSRIFAQTDVTVVPSLCYENSPTVVFESLAHGVPVLAARIGGIDFVKDNENGFTFEAGSSDDLKRVLKFALKNKEKIRKMAKKTQESIKGITIENYIQHLERLMR
jgi:glycosyltransferase involved in cell wall biosynthesis